MRRNLDQRRVQNPIVRDQPLELDARLIEADFASLDVGDYAAGLDYQRRARRDVPFTFRRARKGCVALPCRDQRELVRNAAGRTDFEHPVKYLPLAARGLAPAREHGCALERPGASDMHPVCVQMTSHSTRRPVHLALDGIVSHAENRHAVLDQRNRNREFRNAVDELLGPVKRIDDPHAPAFEPRVVVHGLFGEPAVFGKRIVQQLLDRAIGLEIGGSDRIVDPLRSDFVAAPSPMPAQNFSGDSRGLFRQRQLALQIVARRLQRHSSRSRAFGAALQYRRFVHLHLEPHILIVREPRKSYPHQRSDSIAQLCLPFCRREPKMAGANLRWRAGTELSLQAWGACDGGNCY